MMLAIAVAKYLDTQVTGITYSEATGGNVFINAMPSSPDVAVAIMATGGRSQPSKHAISLPSLQFIVRGPSPVASHALATAILDALDSLDMVTLDDGGAHEVYVHGFTAAQSAPISMGLDENRRHEWSVNIDSSTYAPSPNRSAA